MPDKDGSPTATEDVVRLWSELISLGLILGFVAVVSIPLSVALLYKDRKKAGIVQG